MVQGGARRFSVKCPSDTLGTCNERNGYSVFRFSGREIGGERVFSPSGQEAKYAAQSPQHLSSYRIDRSGCSNVVGGDCPFGRGSARYGANAKTQSQKKSRELTAKLLLFCNMVYKITPHALKELRATYTCENCKMSRSKFRDAESIRSDTCALNERNMAWVTATIASPEKRPLIDLRN
jgi:hypothetical protein